jgi:hypothetical protein
MIDMPARLRRRPVSQFIALPRSVKAKGLHSREDAPAPETMKKAETASATACSTELSSIIPLNGPAREWYNPVCTDFCSQAAGRVGCLSLRFANQGDSYQPLYYQKHAAWYNTTKVY